MQTNFYSFFQSQKVCLVNPKAQALNSRQSQGKSQLTLVKKAAFLQISSFYATPQFRYFTGIESVICGPRFREEAEGNYSFLQNFFPFFNTDFRSNSLHNSKVSSTASFTESLDAFPSNFASTLGFAGTYANRTTTSNLLSFFHKYDYFFTSKKKAGFVLSCSKQARYFFKQILFHFAHSAFFTENSIGVVNPFDYRFFVGSSKSRQRSQQKTMAKRGLISTLFTRTFVRRFKKKSGFRVEKSKAVNLSFKFASSNTLFKGNQGKGRLLPFFSKSYYPTQNTGINLKSSKKKVQKNRFKVAKAPKSIRVLTTKTFDRKLQPKALAFKLYSSSVSESVRNPSPFSQVKAVLGLITQSRITLYQINALSLARFAFSQEQERLSLKGLLGSKQDFLKKTNKSMIKLSQRFLRSLERERTSRFRYVAIFIKDLIRVSFFCRYLKKASFLVSFFAFTLSKLPRNRKETNFLRFLMKLVKVFATQRKEILGLRFRFQGRVNR